MTTQISANYSLEDIYVNEVEIVEVGHDKINFKATGSITPGCNGDQIPTCDGAKAWYEKSLFLLQVVCGAPLRLAR